MTAIALRQGTDLATAPTVEEVERTASQMARTFREATAEIERLLLAINAESAKLRAAFDPEATTTYSFGLDVSYHNQRFYSEDFGKIKDTMSREAWRVLFIKLGVKGVMSVKRRKEFDNQLERGKLPEITEANILGIICGLADDAKDFAREAAKEVFDVLTPKHNWGGEYKTNSAFRVGRKVILCRRVERCWNAKQYRPNHYREQELIALDGIFHLLDGKGVIKDGRGPLCTAIIASPDGRGETPYFAFKCFKNGNLHLTMKRLDLVKELNGLAAGEYVLGEDMTEA
jgi:hypothetical protein